MLAEVKPDIVSLCMRHIDCHAEMAIAAAESGVKGIFMEKPFVRTAAAFCGEYSFVAPAGSAATGMRPDCVHLPDFIER